MGVGIAALVVVCAVMLHGMAVLPRALLSCFGVWSLAHRVAFLWLWLYERGEGQG